MMHAQGRPALEEAFGRIRRDRAQAFLVSGIGVVLAHAEEIVDFAARERLPAVYGRAEYVRVGGLASYDIDRDTARARGADFVQRVVSGAKPAELPVEQVTKFHIALNIRTARALGLQIPASMRLRADELIE
jgi:putative ABC transport system substrate-binding protein